MAGLAERSAGATRSRSMTLICWESRVATPTDAANETSAASRPTPIRTSPSPTTPDHPSTSGSPVAGPRRHRGVVVTAVAAVALSVSMVGCSDSDVDETPVPGGTVAHRDRHGPERYQHGRPADQRRDRRGRLTASGPVVSGVPTLVPVGIGEDVEVATTPSSTVRARRPMPRPPRREQLRLLRQLLRDPQPALDELRARYGPVVGLGAGPVRLAVVGEPEASATSCSPRPPPSSGATGSTSSGRSSAGSR